MPKHEANASSTISDNPRKKQASISSWFPSSTKDTIAPSLTETKDSSISGSPAVTKKIFVVYCDLDGVLVDFEAGVRKLFRGRGPKEVNTSSMWAEICRADRFYYNLPWMSDGKILWNSIRHLSPNILTGVPMNKQSRQDKAQWCKRELGVSTNHVDMAGPKSSHQTVSGRKSQSLDVVNVITCWSRNKHFESGANSVLIDDRIDLSEEWVGRGGIFIHHTDTKSTLQKLRDKGILMTPADLAVEGDSGDEIQILSDSTGKWSSCESGPKSLK